MSSPLNSIPLQRLCRIVIEFNQIEQRVALVRSLYASSFAVNAVVSKVTPASIDGQLDAVQIGLKSRLCDKSAINALFERVVTFSSNANCAAGRNV